MTAIEIVLIVIGSFLMIASFFVMEKLSNREINKMAELSDSEIERILERKMKETGQRIDNIIDKTVKESIEQSAEQVERALDKETNEKIKAIGEYSDTVLESINKTHNEVMFLYSMLNDKHSELTNYAGKLQELASYLEKLQKNTGNMIKDNQKLQTGPEERTVMVKAAETRKENPMTETKSDETDKKHKILSMYQAGLGEVDIARRLGMGVGEVKLIIGLFREEDK